MTCAPCQVGGKEYKAYGDVPTFGNLKSSYRADLIGRVLIKNDYDKAYNNSGKELGRYIPYHTVSTTPLPEICDTALSFEQFLKSNITRGPGTEQP